ncbi:hypothetical protein P9B03_02070 [Metasolibacillus meyeri]|uniref:Uncharacterized protein n=1 Tax=Metasolibacillus meyeri TaxID=1071052 RepID=A0AAW9NHP3_9BACL|nr:hypothetical protein [Metasolibacillus meyeri]MEC1177257.1 hypothetical protein [Metasolibacillus meyeri]
MKSKLNRGFENFFYRAFIIVFAMSLLLFFTSKWWLYDDDPIKQTPFNRDIAGLDQTTLVLKKWHYNPDKLLMEVMLETKHTGADQVKPTFAFAAKASQTMDVYPIKIVYQQDNQFVLHIEQVPKDYKVIGVFVKELRDPKILESAARDQLLAEKGSIDKSIELELPKPKEKIVVGDYREIQLDKTLDIKSKLAYQVEFISLEILQLDRQIETLETQQLPLQDEIVASIKNEIVQLESEQVYKTDDEKQAVQQQIAKKKVAIENVREKQKQYEERIQALQQKREKLLEKIEKIQQRE